MYYSVWTCHCVPAPSRCCFLMRSVDIPRNTTGPATLATHTRQCFILSLLSFVDVVTFVIKAHHLAAEQFHRYLFTCRSCLGPDSFTNAKIGVMHYLSCPGIRRSECPWDLNVHHWATCQIRRPEWNALLRGASRKRAGVRGKRRC